MKTRMNKNDELLIMSPKAHMLESIGQDRFALLTAR